jgi:hypothetical protein
MRVSVPPLMMFRRARARNTQRRTVLPVLLVPAMLLLAAALVFSLGDAEVSNGQRADSAAMVAAEALAGEFAVLAAALP